MFEGAAALDKKSKKQFEATELARLGARADKAPRMPASVGKGASLARARSPAQCRTASCFGIHGSALPHRHLQSSTAFCTQRHWLTMPALGASCRILDMHILHVHAHRAGLKRKHDPVTLCMRSANLQGSSASTTLSRCLHAKSAGLKRKHNTGAERAQEEA